MAKAGKKGGKGKSRFRKKGKSDDLMKRTKESYDRKDSSGKFNNYFKEDMSVPLWKIGPDNHVIDIIPYLTGEHDPKLDKDQRTYVLELWVHQKVGVNEDAFVCPQRNYDLPCPICDYQQAMRDNPDFDDDDIKSVNPKRRVVYNVVVYDDADQEKKGVQVMECSHFLMEKKLVALAKNPRKGFVPFSDEDEGKSISFTKEGTQKSTTYEGHQFLDRDDVISDELLDGAFTLDECIERVDHDHLKSKFDSALPFGEIEGYEASGDDESTGKDVPQFTKCKKCKEPTDDCTCNAAVICDDCGEDPCECEPASEPCSDCGEEPCECDQSDEFDEMDRKQLITYNKDKELGVKVKSKKVMDDDELREAIREALPPENDICDDCGETKEDCTCENNEPCGDCGEDPCECSSPCDDCGEDPCECEPEPKKDPAKTTRRRRRK